jgi:RNA-binding protein
MPRRGADDDAGVAMRTLSADERRALLRAAHGLKPRMTIGRGGVTDSLIAQVRQALSKQPLMKIRVTTRERAETEAVGEALSRRVPCVYVGRVGFVITVYRAGDRPDDIDS